MEQKYDIGHGVIITPSISGIRAEWVTDDEKKSSKSVGLSWPITKPDVEVEIISSILRCSRENSQGRGNFFHLCPRGMA